MKSDVGFRKGVMGIVVTAALCLAGSTVNAQSVTTERQTVNTPPAATTGTTVVQAPAPQAVQVQPTPTPVVNSKQVVTETHSENFMGTIAKNTFYGAVAGALVGGAIYFLDRDTMSGATVGYWAAGGALVGAGVGIVEVSMREDRNERAISQLMGGGRRTSVAFVPRLVNVRF